MSNPKIATEIAADIICAALVNEKYGYLGRRKEDPTEAAKQLADAYSIIYQAVQNQSNTRE